MKEGTVARSDVHGLFAAQVITYIDTYTNSLQMAGACCSSAFS